MQRLSNFLPQKRKAADKYNLTAKGAKDFEPIEDTCLPPGQREIQITYLS
jgi:hypothetical protein